MVHGWSRELAARGHEVRILAGRTGAPPRELPPDEVRDGYRVARWTSKRRTFWDGYLSAIGACRAAARRINKEWPPDIVHCHQGLSAYGLLRAGIAAPVVCTFHSPWRDEFIEDARSREETLPPAARPLYRLAAFLKKRRVHQMEGRALLGSRAIAVLSAFSRERLAAAHGISPESMNVIPGGVDLERFKPVSGEERARIRSRLGFSGFTILSVRRLVRRMGIDLLLEAMVQICSRVPDVKLIVVGRGAERESLERMANELGVGKAVTFAGFVPDEELPDYYRAADLYILPSRSLEGFGMTTLEALASGLPVVGTPVGATPEILKPLEEGLVAAGTTPRAIAKAAHPWLTFPSALEDMRSRCRGYAESRFRWSDAGEALENLYRDILQDRGAP